MKPLPRASSERKFTAASWSASPQIRKLTAISKSLYRAFNVIEMQMSRLYALKGFQQIVQELIDFNQELIQWKADRREIRNLVVTYHLYQNLFSRLRFISVFSNKEEEAVASINAAIKWFAVEKPEKRNFIPETDAEMRPRQTNPEEDTQLHQLIQSNAIKHEMLVFETMSRTAHSGFFPPKELLKDYRRKQFAPILDMEGQKHLMSAAKTTSSSFTSKLGKTSYRNSLATRSSMKDTRSSFKLDEKKDSIPQNQEVENLQAVEQADVLEDQFKEKVVKQEEMIQNCIVPEKFEEDQPDENQQFLESQEDEQGPKELRVKKFVRDPDVDEELVAQERIKEKQQSTIRRIISHKQEKIRIQLEELDMKRHMGNWGKLRTKSKAQKSRKIQQMHSGNRYKDLEHRVINPHVKDLGTQNLPPTTPMLYRSKSSHPGSIESEIEKIKIQNTLKTYGRYIQHGNPRYTIPEIEQDPQELKKFRCGSLTSHTEKRLNKKKQFCEILQENNEEAYNQQSQAKLFDIKSALAKKHISISNKNLLTAMVVPRKTDLKGAAMYSSGSSLLSNPFFPKGLFQSKKSKKKR